MAEAEASAFLDKVQTARRMLALALAAAAALAALAEADPAYMFPTPAALTAAVAAVLALPTRVVRDRAALFASSGLALVAARLYSL